eukprot:gene2715-2965_t
MGNYNTKDDPHNIIPEDDIIPSRSIRPPPAPEPIPRAAVEEQLQPILSDSTADSVPTVFKWEHGGRHVYITGTFNNWERQIPMHRSGNDFTYVHNLKRGKHAFKFIVDDEWRYAPDQPTIADVEGRINNFIDVSDFQPYTGDDTFFVKSKDRKIGDDEFKQNIPDLDDYTKEPPALPPHLRHIILNKPSPTIDTQSLPVPQYVSLNHLYCTAIKDGMMVLGATQRCREKYFTVVFYSVMPTSGTHYS